MKNRLLLIICLLFSFGCESETYSSENAMVIPVVEKKAKESAWRTGEVHYLPFEGGFYGIIAENGDKLLPLNLSQTYYQHGTIIKFKGVVIKDMMTTKQWGEVFELSEVKLIKAGQRKDDQPTY